MAPADLSQVEKVAEKRAAAVAQQVVIQQSESWSGPMPSPRDLEAYNNIFPGLAKTIVDTFAAQSTHRRELEAIVVDGSERRADRGQIIVASLVALVILSGLWVALTSNGYAGAAMITAALAGGVWLYHIGGRPPDRQE